MWVNEEGMFSAIRRKRRFWFCFGFENMPLPFSDFPFKSCLLFLKVWSTHCLQHQKNPRAGVRALTWGISVSGSGTKGDCSFTHRHLGCLRDTRHFSSSWSAPHVLTQGFSWMDTLQKNGMNWMFLKWFLLYSTHCVLTPKSFFWRNSVNSSFPVFSKFLGSSRLNYIKIGSFRSFHGNSFWTVIHGVSEQAVQGASGVDPQGLLLSQLWLDAVADKIAVDQILPLLGGEKDSAIFFKGLEATLNDSSPGSFSADLYVFRNLVGFGEKYFGGLCCCLKYDHLAISQGLKPFSWIVKHWLNLCSSCF